MNGQSAGHLQQVMPRRRAMHERHEPVDPGPRPWRRPVTQIIRMGGAVAGGCATSRRGTGWRRWPSRGSDATASDTTAVILTAEGASSIPGAAQQCAPHSQSGAEGPGKDAGADDSGEMPCCACSTGGAIDAVATPSASPEAPAARWAACMVPVATAALTWGA